MVICVILNRWFAKFLLEGNIFPVFKGIAVKEHWKEMIHQSLQQSKLHPKVYLCLVRSHHLLTFFLLDFKDFNEINRS